MEILLPAVDHDGETIGFLLLGKRGCAAAQGFLERTIHLHGVPTKITIDVSAANTVAILSIRAGSCPDIEMRQTKNLNSIVEQHDRAIKRIVWPLLGFKTCHCAAIPAGVGIMHMVKVGQLVCSNAKASPPSSQIVSLVF